MFGEKQFDLTYNLYLNSNNTTHNPNNPEKAWAMEKPQEHKPARWREFYKVMLPKSILSTKREKINGKKHYFSF